VTPFLAFNAEHGSREWIIDLIVENSPILEVIKVLDQHSLDQFQVGNYSSSGEKEEEAGEWIVRALVLQVVVPENLRDVSLLGPVLDIPVKWMGHIVRNTPSLPISMTSAGHEQQQRHQKRDQR